MTIFFDGKTEICPIWKHEKIPFQGNENYCCYNSIKAGGYFCLTYDAKIKLENYRENNEFRIKFSSYVYEKQQYIDIKNLGVSLIENAINAKSLEDIKNRTLLNFSEKKEKLFQWLMLKEVGHIFSELECLTSKILIGLEFNGQDAHYQNSMFRNFILVLSKDGSLEYDKSSNSFSITSKGYEYIEMLQRGGVNSKNAFVAMWFHPETRNFYEQALKQTLLECGYQEPFRVDQKDHINKIDDEIIAMLRRARFVIVDMTSGFENILPTEKNPERKIYIPRGGVYYEAGFAHGLDRPVIWTCKHDCIKNLHFDIRQYNMLQWHEVDGHYYVYSDDSSKGKPGQLFKDALFNRISALNLNLNQL